MRPVPRSTLTIAAALTGLALVAGCTGSADPDARPKPKPAQMTVKMADPNRAPGSAGLTRARVSTMSGEILILEPDGQVTTMALDSPEGQDAFAVSESDLALLEGNLDLDLSGMVAVDSARGPTAQERAIEEFAARTQPALPAWNAATKLKPEDFIGVRVEALPGKGGSDLVEVTANLRKGVDADIAFSYATCALAGWAKSQGAPYGRHIRTLQDTRNGKLLIGAAFTISKDKPLGLRVMETNETLRECKARGIPAA